MARDVRSKRARFFSAVSSDPPRPARLSLRGAALPLFLVAVVIAIASPRPAIRFTVPVFLFAIAVALVARSRAARLKQSRNGRGISLDGHNLCFQSDGGASRVVAVLRDPFGVTIVKSPERDRIVAVWSSPNGLFYVGTTVDGSTKRTVASLLERAFTVHADDAALQAIAPDGLPLDLHPSDFADLIAVVEEIDPASSHRLVLSDARGAPFTLDGRELVVGERKFDLEAPIEWRPFVFKEVLGQSITIYQGTAIRQGSSETVLVSLLPSTVPFDVREVDQLDVGTLRDLRLAQVTSEEPPPRDARVAIDRLFVLPVRSALDAAPQASRYASRARA